MSGVQLVKPGQLRAMTTAELREQLEENRQELFNLRFQASTQQLENPRRMREVRKNIARVLTILSERATAVAP